MTYTTKSAYVTPLRPGVTLNPDKKSIAAIVWAPFAGSIEIETHNEQRFPLGKSSYGCWENHNIALKAGDLYHIVIDGEKKLPDPASLSQPEDVHGPSQVTDLNTHQWEDHNWKGIPLHKQLIYELHPGTFSSGGNFRGIIDGLDYLVGLGINTIEIMPVAQFPGERNWGYDGVYPFAVQDSYGGVSGLQELVDACHSKGIAVILDVVYNHLGPEGNYLNEFGPYFTDKYKTPWGQAINFDDAWCDGVRNFFIENALMWIRDFHIDGLRLDAVHAIKDFGANHFLAELKEAVEEQSKTSGRYHFLIAECDLNDVRYLNPFQKGGYNMDAQWCDEFHHALHALVTRESTGYYADFGGIGPLTRSFNNGYVYDGIYSPHRKKVFGSKTTGQPGHKFVVFSQNHDHVGNRMLGERLSALISYEMQKVVAAACILSPFTPLLFMGEEYGERNPFLYFTSHKDPRLIEGVREGRKKEFKDFMKDREPPDAQSEATFQESKLTPQNQWDSKQEVMFRWYQLLIQMRKTQDLWHNGVRDHMVAEKLTDSVLEVTGKTTNKTFRILFNFGSGEFEYQTVSVKKILLNSASPQWDGKTNNEDLARIEKKIIVPGESVIMFY